MHEGRYVFAQLLQHLPLTTFRDRGYLDFERLARLDDAGSFFVTRRQV